MQKDEIVKRLKEFFASREDVKFAYLFGSVAIRDIIKEGIVLKSSNDMAEWEVKKYHKALDFIAHTKAVYGY